jgi:membrane protein DedA with SNARE-associated domain
LAELDHVLGYLEPWVHDYGSAAIFVILTLESFGFPLPGESLLIAAAILAGRGAISLPVLLLSAWCGAVIGDNIGYLIGRALGHGLLSRYGEKIGLKPDRLRKVEAIFGRYGAVTVGFARFFNVLRQLNGVVAGTLEMQWWKFLLFNALGGALWVMLWTMAGYYFGTHGSEIATLLRRFGFIGGITVSIVVTILLICMFMLQKIANSRVERRENINTDV